MLSARVCVEAIDRQHTPHRTTALRWVQQRIWLLLSPRTVVEKLQFTRNRGQSVVFVDMITEAVDLVERLVTLCTGVVMKCDVLCDTSG